MLPLRPLFLIQIVARFSSRLSRYSLVATLMKRMGIQAVYRKPNTSKPAPGHKIYPYLLRNLPVTRPNQVWAMDLTYVPMARGFVHLAAVIDWFSRRVLSWRLSITMEAGFCVEADPGSVGLNNVSMPDFGVKSAFIIVDPYYQIANN